MSYAERTSAHETPDAVEAERRRLTGLCYRLTGSWADAEDAVQETYARWFALAPHDRDSIAVPAAWLTTVAGRLCLDLLRSARVRREQYVGEWLPEPVPEAVARAASPMDAGADPADRALLDESLSIAFLVLLESMTPAERVAFVLHDVFRYSFLEIGGILDRTPAAARQLASSARRRTRATPPAASASASEHSGVVRRLRLAWEAGDVAALIGLLDPDVVMVADGGGVAGAALRPVRGAAAVARYIIGIAEHTEELTLVEREVNGRAGLVAERAGAPATVAAFEVSGGRIVRAWAVRNPDKLRLWGAA